MPIFPEKRFLPKRDASPAERERLVKAITDRLSREPDILFAYLHGSFAAGETFRDIDIGIFFGKTKDLTCESDLSYELSTALGPEVEVRVINDAPVAFQMAVLTGSTLLVSRDDAARAEFIENVGRRYREYAHFRNVFREAVGGSSERVAKGIVVVPSAKVEMEKLLSGGKAAFLTEPKNAHALKYLLIEAVEAITDVCQHLLARKKGVVCSGYVDCIVKAGENGVIKVELSKKLRKLADLRNSLIHRYWIINDEELFTQCSADVGDLPDFCRQVSER
jgi:uncharacterized protein YutE (UPF0331/DUF86 family)/predicted nucleotidyltransferase